MTELKQEIERLRALNAARTQGNWAQSHRARPNGMYDTQVYNASNGKEIANVCWYDKPMPDGSLATFRADNAAFIAAAPAMMSVIEKLVAELETARADALEEAAKVCELYAHEMLNSEDHGEMALRRILTARSGAGDKCARDIRALAAKQACKTSAPMTYATLARHG